MCLFLSPFLYLFIYIHLFFIYKYSIIFFLISFLFKIIFLRLSEKRIEPEKISGYINSYFFSFFLDERPTMTTISNLIWFWNCADRRAERENKSFWRGQVSLTQIREYHLLSKGIKLFKKTAKFFFGSNVSNVIFKGCSSYTENLYEIYWLIQPNAAIFLDFIQY